ncbi:hypothetical protein [Haladaptatus sp. NG-WS-4]
MLLFGLTVWYGTLAPAPELGAYPNEEHLADDYDQYLGKKVSVSGAVVDTDPMTIDVEYGANEHIQLTITDLAVDANEGDNLRVYGVVAPNHTIQSLNAFAVSPSGYLYMYPASFFAGLWVLGRIIQYWRLDLTDWTLKRRKTPFQPKVFDRVQTRIHQWREN